MSKGNLKTSGGKGTNYPYQLAVLQLLGAIAAGGGGGGGGCPCPSSAQEITLAALNAKLNSLGQKANAASAPVTLSTEQEALLTTIAGLAAITSHTFGATLTGIVGVGSVPAGTAYSIIVHNIGLASGLVNGATIPAGASRTYTAAYKKSLPALSYDGTGTILEIEILNY